MDTYQSPLITRSASAHMARIWSQNHKFELWRKLWYELAKAQYGLELPPITVEHLAALEKALEEPIDLELAAEFEKEMHHDVMAHIAEFGTHAPIAKGIIHLGATSQFVVDNADTLRIRESLNLIISKLTNLIIKIGDFAQQHKAIATLGLTHFQPAQPTTVGKRAASWAYDLHLVLEQLIHNHKHLRMRGVKGATGTQASFLELFDSPDTTRDQATMKVRILDEMVTRAFGFQGSKGHYHITGQTYPRISDAIITSSLAAIGAVCQKIATDIRLLAGKKELMEGFDSKQVGSSAMPYKKNPLYCERICGLAKFLIPMASTSMTVAAEQWLERSLDDSSARRLLLPESYLTADGIIDTMHRVFDGLVVNEVAISSNLSHEIEFLMTEKVLMIGVKHGANRQELHEKIKQCTLKCREKLNPSLLYDVSLLPEFEGIDLGAEVMGPASDFHLIGLAVEQVDHFIESIIAPLKAQQTESDH